MGEISDALRRAKRQASPSPILPSQAPGRDEPLPEPRSDPRSSISPSPPNPPIEAVSSPRNATRAQSEFETRPAIPAESSEPFDITREGKGSRVERISLLDPNSPAAMSARQLAQQMKRQAMLRHMRSIVITSPLSGDGKTTISCNLAIASTGLDRSRSIALVELDLRRPRMAQCLGLELHCGVDDVLDGTASLAEAVLKTNVPGLSIVAVREGRLAPEYLLASENLSKLIRSLEEKFSMVIIDTPPVLSVADTLSVIDVADGCLLVVRAGSCPTASVRSAIEHLPMEKMLGCCLNFARSFQAASSYENYPVVPAGEKESQDSREVFE